MKDLKENTFFVNTIISMPNTFVSKQILCFLLRVVRIKRTEYSINSITIINQIKDKNFGENLFSSV